MTTEVTSRFITSCYRIRRLLIFCENSLSLRVISGDIAFIAGIQLTNFGDRGGICVCALQRDTCRQAYRVLISCIADWICVTVGSVERLE